MLNATSSSSNPMTPPFPSVSGPDTARIIPPQVLPSQSQSTNQVIRPATAPHGDVTSLSDSLAAKINPTAPSDLGAQSAGQAGSGMGGGTPGETPITQVSPGTTGMPPSKKFSLKTIVAVVLLVLAVVGSGATYYLSINSQDLRQQAAESYSTYCSAHDGKTDTGVACSSITSESTCWTHGGSGCSWNGSCFCGSGGNTSSGSILNATSCGSNPNICNTGTSTGKITVAECREDGYTGNSCRVGCGSHQVSVPAGGCVSVGVTKPACGRWQVDVHNAQTGATLCADFSCEASGCTATPPTTTPSTAEVSMPPANCPLLSGKYVAGTPIAFAEKVTSGNPAVNETGIFIAKVDAAGTSLVKQGETGATCLDGAGTITGALGVWCKIGSSAVSGASFAGTITWNKPIVGKYVVTVNAMVPNGTSCSGNPTCEYSTDSPFINKTSCGGFTNCSSNDWHTFEVVAAESCTATPTLAVCGKFGGTDAKCATGNQYIGYCVKPELEGTSSCINAVRAIHSGMTPEQLAAAEKVVETSCCSVAQAGPMCMSITAERKPAGSNTWASVAANSTLQIGDKLRFTCGQVNAPGMTMAYNFRVKENGSPVIGLNAEGRSSTTLSKEFSVLTSGSLQGQCAICPGGTSCYPFEP